MRGVAFLKVADFMNNSPLVFSAGDPVSKFIGTLHQHGCREALVVFKNRIGIVSALDILDVSHPERTLLGNVARRALSIDREATLLDAVDAMVTNGLGVLPVVEGKEVVGMISCNDVLDVMAGSHVLDDVICGDVMRAFRLSVGVRDKVSTARSIMCKHDVGFLPVVDDEGFLEGVITARDIVLAFMRPDDSVTRGEMVGESVGFLSAHVGELMDSSPLTAREDDFLVDVVDDFRRMGKDICVISLRDYFGIITPMEIVALLLRFRARNVVRVRFLGLPVRGDFLGLGTIQDKLTRVLKAGFTFHKGVREVIVDVKPKKESGGRTFYQVIARIYSSARPLVVTAHGWYLGEAINRLHDKLDRVLKRYKRRRKRGQGRYSHEHEGMV
ncbi:MAG: hypothetical protein DRZ82_08020 [Thermoprotei archaeon]|nr:MAG: hypothetical protein DRZ82_08020 [Thermoprotei archaeon]